MPKHNRLTDEEFDEHLQNRDCVECDRYLGIEVLNPKAVRHRDCARNVILGFLTQEFGEDNVKEIFNHDN